MVEISKDKFNEFIFGKPISIVDFYAPWCSPCKILAPKLATWGEKYKVSVAKLDITDNMDLATQHGINMLPTVVFFKNGKEHKRLIGLFNEDEFKRTIE